MKVMIVFFDIIEPGGINRVIQGMLDGFRKNGVEADYYHASKFGNLRYVFPDKVAVISSRIYRMPATGQIGFGKKHLVKAYKKLVKNYDAVIMMLPCPHDNKQQKGERNWQELYDIDKPIFVVFHDNYWMKYYRWLEEVKDKISASLYTVRQAKKDSLAHFQVDHYWFPVP